MPERYYLPPEALMALKRAYDVASVQDHWFLVRWGLHRGAGEEFVLPARSREEALSIIQNRLSELKINTTGSWDATERAFGTWKLTATVSSTAGGDFWPPEMVRRAELAQLNTVEQIRAALDNEIARFDTLQRQFEKWASDNPKEKRGRSAG